jgi:chitodextrinase
MKRTIAIGIVGAGVFVLASIAFAQQMGPSAPASISAYLTQSGQIYVSWNVSSDATPGAVVEGYYLYRNGAMIASIPGWTYYTDTIPAGVYYYTVTAYDSLGSVSPQSHTTTPISVLADTAPPTTPQNLTATAGSSSVVLSWQGSTDNLAVVGYYIYRSSRQVLTPNAITGTTYTDTGLTPGTTYSYTVTAYDATGNVSNHSNSVTVTAIFDTTPPSVPTGVSANATSTTAVIISWQPSMDNIGIGGYSIYRDGNQLANVVSSTTFYFDNSLAPQTTHYYWVVAYDVVGNRSAASAQVNATTQAQDYTPPSIPNGFAATPVSASQITLSWWPSTDNVHVAGYYLFRNGIQIASTASTTYADSNLATSTTYTYMVKAYDAAGNISAQASVAATTLATSPVAPPPVVTAPTPIPAPTPTPTPTPVPTPANSTFTTLLYNGLRGGQVTALQNVLIAHGYLGAAYGTGFFGSLTQKAVQQFQCAQNIVCSGSPAATGWGLVGARTRKALNAL